MPRPRAQSGFTLAELVIVIMLIGILSVGAATRLLDRGLIDARGFADQATAALRFAQKAAVAQRRPVVVLIDTSARRVRACLDVACAQPLASAAGGNLDVSAGSTVTVTSAIAQFSFDALGRPSFGSTQSVTATGGGTTYTITIQADTGYVQRS